MKKHLLAVVVAGMWVNLWEFVRNELVVKQQWLDRFAEFHTSFPSAPINAVVWMTWGFVLAACLVRLRTRFSLVETMVIGWVMGFALMWLVIGNLGVLPFGILPYAVPWSLVEVGGAVMLANWIVYWRKVKN